VSGLKCLMFLSICFLHRANAGTITLNPGFVNGTNRDALKSFIDERRKAGDIFVIESQDAKTALFNKLRDVVDEGTRGFLNAIPVVGAVISGAPPTPQVGGMLPSGQVPAMMPGQGVASMVPVI